MKTDLNIFILEDNRFYNSLLSKCVRTYMLDHTKVKPNEYQLSSFFNIEDLMLNLGNINQGIFLLDYYLESNQNANNVIDFLEDQNIKHSVAILSRFENYQTFDNTFISGASAFIKKDRNALHKIRVFLDETLTIHYRNI